MKLPETSEVFESVLEFHRHGIRSLLPVKFKEKSPDPRLLPNWKPFQVEPPTNEQLWEWFGNGTPRNLFVVCGAVNRLVVVDCDNDAAIGFWEQRLGPDALWATTRVRTSKGVHFYFQLRSHHDIHSWQLHEDGIDFEVQSDGKGVVGPGSVHKSGHEYRFEVGLDQLAFASVALAKGPQDGPQPGATGTPLGTKLVELLGRPPQGEGARNDWLTRVSGHYAKQFRNMQDAYEEHVRAANDRLESPLSGTEVRKVTDSVWRAEHRQTRELLREHRTDRGNARRLVIAHGHDLRYCAAWGQWFVWDGRRWGRDLTQEVERRAKDAALRIYTEAATAEAESERKDLASWARKSESAARLRDMVRLAQSEPEIAMAPDSLDADPWLLNVRNGTLDLRSGDLRPHNPNDLITKLGDVDYDPKAKCLKWQEFLDRVTQGDADLGSYLQRAVGYSLTGRVSEQVLFFLYGSGANGKSTFLNVLRDLLGDYGHQAPPDLLLAQSNDPHPTGMAGLQGRRFVECSEIDEGRRWAEVTVKQLTGGDRITARFMRQDYFEFEPTFKIWLAANHKPTVRGRDHAIWRRLKLVGFEASIPLEEQIPDLHERLITDEAPGILRWAVEGCLDWQHEGLAEPAPVSEAVATYRNEEDVLGDFLEDCFESEPQDVLVSDDSRWFTTNAELMGAYQDWAKRNSERPLSQRELGRALQERGFATDRRKRGRGRVGLRPRRGG